MISQELAVELARRGLTWHPAAGDRFHVPDRDLDDEVFVISGMAIDVADLPTGAEMRFNGTVEWALDSIAQSEVVWLPREDQLREALGPSFTGLERLPGEPAGFAVVLEDGSRFVDVDAERAYARALLSLLPGLPGPPTG